MLLGRFYFVAFALPIRLQSYWCFLATFYYHSVATFMFIYFIKRSAILRFFIVLGGGYVELSLRFNVPPTWTL